MHSLTASTGCISCIVKR